MRKPNQQTIRQMLDDVEAVTRSRFYEDPDYLVSPRELFRVPEGESGGEPFAALRAREQLDVLWIYTPSYEARGVSGEQMEQVFRNIIIGEKPREQWLEGTGLDGRPAAKPLTLQEAVEAVMDAVRKVAEHETASTYAADFRPTRKNDKDRGQER